MKEGERVTDLVAAWARPEVFVAQVELFHAERADLLLFILVDELILLRSCHWWKCDGSSVPAGGGGWSRRETSAPARSN